MGSEMCIRDSSSPALASRYPLGRSASNASTSSLLGILGIRDLSNGSESPGCAANRVPLARRPPASVSASGISVSPCPCACASPLVVVGGGGVAAAPAARERRLFPRFDCAVVGGGVGAAGVAAAAAAVAEDEGGGARAARASASERWFAKVFWDWRILRTAGVTLPCVAVSLSVLYLLISSQTPHLPSPPAPRQKSSRLDAACSGKPRTQQQ